MEMVNTIFLFLENAILILYLDEKQNFSIFLLKIEKIYYKDLYFLKYTFITEFFILEEIIKVSW